MTDGPNSNRQYQRYVAHGDRGTGVGPPAILLFGPGRRRHRVRWKAKTLLAPVNRQR